VPADPLAAGPAAPGRWQTAAFGDQPGPLGPAGRRTDIRDSGPLWPAGLAPAGQVLTVAEEQAAAITHEAWDQAAAIRQAAEQEAAAIRQQAASQAAAIEQQATGQAAAIRQAAEREAAELKAALLALSGEMSSVATYVTENLASPVLPGTRPSARPAPGPGIEPEASPFAEPLAPPARPRTRPATTPQSPPARPRTEPAPRPDVRPAKKPTRQLKAFRLATLTAAGALTLTAISGGYEISQHGLRFFIFRQGGTGASGDNSTDQGFLDSLAKAHQHPAKGRHAIGNHAHGAARTHGAAKTSQKK
jgi:hypothetical protein